MVKRAYIKNVSLSLVEKSSVQRAHNKHLRFKTIEAVNKTWNQRMYTGIQ